MTLDEAIEDKCPTVDLYGKSPKECWILGYKAALKSMDIAASFILNIGDDTFSK